MNPLASTLAAVFEQIVNAGIGLDPDTAARLAALNSRTIVIRATVAGGVPGPIGEPLTITIVDGRILVHAMDTDDANVRVSGNPTSLLRAVMGDSDVPDDVTIDGDMTLLEELRAIVSGYRPEVLAGGGGGAARPLTEVLLDAAELGLAAARSVLEGAGHAARRSAHDQFVSDEDLTRLADSAQSLVMRLDRLSARVQRLESGG